MIQEQKKVHAPRVVNTYFTIALAFFTFLFYCYLLLRSRRRTASIVKTVPRHFHKTTCRQNNTKLLYQYDNMKTTQRIKILTIRTSDGRSSDHPIEHQIQSERDQLQKSPKITRRKRREQEIEQMRRAEPGGSDGDTSSDPEETPRDTTSSGDNLTSNVGKRPSYRQYLREKRSRSRDLPPVEQRIAPPTDMNRHSASAFYTRTHASIDENSNRSQYPKGLSGEQRQSWQDHSHPKEVIQASAQIQRAHQQPHQFKPIDQMSTSTHSLQSNRVVKESTPPRAMLHVSENSAFRPIQPAPVQKVEGTFYQQPFITTVDNERNGASPAPIVIAMPNVQRPLVKMASEPHANYATGAYYPQTQHKITMNQPSPQMRVQQAQQAYQPNNNNQYQKATPNYVIPNRGQLQRQANVVELPRFTQNAATYQLGQQAHQAPAMASMQQSSPGKNSPYRHQPLHIAGGGLVQRKLEIFGQQTSPQPGYQGQKRDIITPPTMAHQVPAPAPPNRLNHHPMPQLHVDNNVNHQRSFSHTSQQPSTLSSHGIASRQLNRQPYHTHMQPEQNTIPRQGLNSVSYQQPQYYQQGLSPSYNQSMIQRSRTFDNIPLSQQPQYSPNQQMPNMMRQKTFANQSTYNNIMTSNQPQNVMQKSYNENYHETTPQGSAIRRLASRFDANIKAQPIIKLPDVVPQLRQHISEQGPPPRANDSNLERWRARKASLEKARDQSLDRSPGPTQSTQYIHAEPIVLDTREEGATKAPMHPIIQPVERMTHIEQVRHRDSGANVKNESSPQMMNNYKVNAVVSVPKVDTSQLTDMIESLEIDRQDSLKQRKPKQASVESADRQQQSRVLLAVRPPLSPQNRNVHAQLAIGGPQFTAVVAKVASKEESEEESDGPEQLSIDEKKHIFETITESHRHSQTQLNQYDHNQQGTRPPYLRNMTRAATFHTPEKMSISHDRLNVARVSHLQKSPVMARRDSHNEDRRVRSAGNPTTDETMIVKSTVYQDHLSGDEQPFDDLKLNVHDKAKAWDNKLEERRQRRARQSTQPVTQDELDEALALRLKMKGEPVQQLLKQDTSKPLASPKKVVNIHNEPQQRVQSTIKIAARPLNRPPSHYEDLNTVGVNTKPATAKPKSKEEHFDDAVELLIQSSSTPAVVSGNVKAGITDRLAALQKRAQISAEPVVFRKKTNLAVDGQQRKTVADVPPTTQNKVPPPTAPKTTSIDALMHRFSDSQSQTQSTKDPVIPKLHSFKKPTMVEMRTNMQDQRLDAGLDQFFTSAQAACPSQNVSNTAFNDLAKDNQLKLTTPVKVSRPKRTKASSANPLKSLATRNDVKTSSAPKANANATLIAEMKMSRKFSKS